MRAAMTPGVNQEAVSSAAAVNAPKPRKIGMPARIQTWLRACRVHQWLKNSLVFVPLVTSHTFHVSGWTAGLLAFLALSFASSAIYLLNDIADQAHDSSHPIKKHRPIASGELSKIAAIRLAMGCGLIAFLVSIALPGDFALLLAAYLAVALSYTHFLKRIWLVDLLVLTGLFQIRVLAGGVATGVELSAWLLTFTIPIFFTLACLKRHSEISHTTVASPRHLAGRGYDSGDGFILAVFGIMAAGTSIAALGAYAIVLPGPVSYSRPAFLFGVAALLLAFLSHLWRSSLSGRMHFDLIMFVISDRWSLGLIGVALAMFWFSL